MVFWVTNLHGKSPPKLQVAKVLPFTLSPVVYWLARDTLDIEDSDRNPAGEQIICYTRYMNIIYVLVVAILLVVFISLVL